MENSRKYIKANHEQKEGEELTEVGNSSIGL